MHDIGKNIVTVVLQCNNFEVVNMGVMVPCHEILARAKVEGADIVGLSGLITPSLEEMQYVAGEMQKDEHFRIRKIPLLIGGATTSRVHTAVKIAPHYEGPVVYVPDASRSVSVAQGLLSDQAAKYIAELNADYEKVRQQHANKKQVPLWPLAKARANKTPIAWSGYTPPQTEVHRPPCVQEFRPGRAGEVHRLGPVLPDLGSGRAFPAILKDEVVGSRGACASISDGQRMLKRLIEGRWLTANAVLGLYPANSVNDDDIELYTDETRQQVALTWYGLRQQTEKQAIDGVMRPSRCLADFVAPKGVAPDYVGMFAVTAGIGVDKKEKYFLDDHDDYSAIMLKALADRLAEAFAECLHQRVRTDLWGYAPQEALPVEDLIAEKYQGIRPAPGYPACPDHSVKKDMFALLAVRGDRHGTYREPGHDAGGQRQRLLSEPPGQHLLQRRPDRRGPVAGPGAPPRHRGGAAAKVVGAELVTISRSGVVNRKRNVRKAHHEKYPVCRSVDFSRRRGLRAERSQCAGT